MSLSQRLEDLVAVLGFDVKDLDSRIPYFLATDPWHRVGTAGEPAFGASWVNYNASYFMAFRKGLDGVVRLRGLLKGGANGSSPFTLPVGYRPVQEESYLVFAAGGSAYITITNAGVVSITGQGAANITNYVYFSGIEFDTDTVTEAMVGPKGEQGPAGPPGNFDITAPSVANWNDAPLGAAYALANATNAPAYDAAVDSGLFMAETWEVVDPQDPVNNSFIIQRATDLMTNATFERRSWFGRSSWKAWSKVATNKAPIWTSFAGLYANSWTEYDTARYSKDALGYVQFRGEIRSWTGGATAADVFVLGPMPVGFRPAIRTGCPVWANTGALLSLYVASDGVIRVSTAVSAGAVVNIGSVRYPTQ